MPSLVTRIAPALALLVLLTGCGGDDEPEPDTGATPADGPATGFAVEDGISPDDLLSCLEEAGLPVVPNDSTPMGVEVPVAGLEVGPLDGTGGDSPQGADLWVFTSGTAAAENRANITLTDEDTPTSWLAGNVVVRLFYAPGDDDPQIEELRTCLP